MTNNIIDKVRAEINRRIHNIIRTPEEEEELKRDFPDQYGVVLGYRAALSVIDEMEKEPVSDDLELSWEDIKAIDKLLNQCVDYSNPYQEVLKRFKERKDGGKG